jgi:oligopeptide transport system substrate-binding protein
LRRRAAVLAAAAALLAAGCARRETQVAAGLRTHTLLVGNYAEPEDLDPQVVTIFTDQRILLALFEGLTAVDAPTSGPVPAAALSWERSADALTWTFHLRPGLKWSNGEPLTAGDFVASWRRILTPSFGAEYAYLLYCIRNAKAFNEGRITDPAQVGVSAPDAATVRIILERPTPYLPTLVGLPPLYPVNPRVLERFGAAATRGTRWTRPGNLVGNGPFTLEEWVPNDRIVVARNPAYWGAGSVSLEKIVFLPVENPDVEERMFRAGQLHVTFSLPVSKVDAYRRDAPGTLRVDPFSQVVFLRFNATRPPFDDPRVRRALSLSIDRDIIAHRVLLDGHPAAHAFVPPGCAGYASTASVGRDVEAARRLLAEAGHPMGAGMRPFELQMRDDGIQPQVAQAIQAMWLGDLGVRVSLVTAEQKTVIQNMQTLNYDVSVAAWAADYLDPTTYLDLFLSDGGNNWTGWKDPQYDRLIGDAENTLDPAARFAVFQRAEARLLESGPVAPLYYGTETYLIDSHVRGWEPGVLGYTRFGLVGLGD